MQSTLFVRQGLEGLRSVPPRSVMSIGNFDGVHRGHLHLLRLARQLRQQTPGSRVVAVTFEPHPLTVLRPRQAPPRLTPSPLKQFLLAQAGVDELVILPPSHDILDLSAEAFWAILRDEARPAHLVEGGSFNFGKDRGGTIDRLREWSRDGGIELHVADSVTVPLLDLSVVPVSSSLIRWLLAHGRVRDAGICLGRSYALVGEVVQGFQRGRTIDVPTANLKCGDQLVPADGVYAGRCTVGGRTYAAAVSIGSLPTFQQRAWQVEAHLIGFDGDLYGETIAVELADWLRDQRRFPDVAALKEQLSRDIAAASELGLRRRHEPIAAG